jgi:hypothetical protein
VKCPKSARLITILLVTAAFALILVHSALEVLRGNGAGIYHNVYGMGIHFIDVLSFAAAFLLALLIGLAIRWWQKRDDRTLDRLLTQAKKRARGQKTP